MSKEKINLNISGMTCVNCSNGIERVVNKLDGLEKSKVSFTANKGEFTIDSDKLDKNTIIQKIRKLGYGVEEDIAALEASKKAAYQKLKFTFLISACLTLLMFYFVLFPIKDINLYIMFAIGSIVQFYPGSRFYVLSYKAIINKNTDMNVLVALGTSAAYFYSTAVVLFPHIFPENLRFVYFDGASVIITFILLGRLLEERSRAKATDFLKRLMDLSPQNANKLEDNGEIVSILAKDLQIGDKVFVKVGEKISADGVIIEGGGDIDTSMITGEPMPVFKTVGDEVVAGTINTQGTLKIQVLKNANENTISKIIALLSAAGSKKLPIARLADKIASIFVPTVISISVLTFLAWYFIFNDATNAILASISVLIISCPCALGLATPIAIVSAVGKGAKEGILIKNPEILEIIKDIKYAVFDKTGTLTKGVISVKDIYLKNEELLGVLSSIEAHSEHPISKAIVDYAKNKQSIKNEQVQNVQIIPGKGVSGVYENKTILIGNQRLLEKNNIHISQEYFDIFTQTLDEGNGAVFVSEEDKCIGVISLEDSLKADAKELILNLKKQAIIPVLLTGDNKITAKKIADTLGIESYYAEVLPDEKYEVIKKLQKEAKVMFIGDGINDSPSIKQADIGITLNSGSDITKDAGDIILINNDLKSVLKSVNLSKRAMSTIKQNLFWAFFYNALGIPLAAGVLHPIIGVMLSPMYAGIAMSFSSVTVVLNSLRLKVMKI